MDYAILLHFDKDSEDRIYELWREAQKLGGDTHLTDCVIRPHITLAIFEDTDIISFCSKLEIFSKQVKKFSLRLESIGTFATRQGVLFLSPVITDSLLELHKGFYGYFEGDIEGINSYYTPNNWVPHCSISMNNSVEVFGSIFERILEVYDPMDAQISEISVIELNPAIRYIKNFELI
jgi:2'-5' RNA ligase